MRREMTIVAVAAISGLLAASSSSKALAVGYTFTDINVPGSQPGSTGFLSLGMNNLGQVVGTYKDSAGNDDGFLYSGGKYVTIDAPGATDTYLYGINDLGHILGVSVDLSDRKTYVFLEAHGKFTNIADISDPLVFNFSPVALNDRDQALGLGRSNYGFLHAKEVITPIDLTGGPGASLSGFNNLDQFTGTVCDGAGCHAFIDTKGVFTNFDYPNASYTAGGGINDWGQVAGVYFDSAGGHGFLYTNGHLTTIQDLNASPGMGDTWPTAINDLGEIAGFYYDAEGAFHSFLGTPRLGLFASAAAAQLANPIPEASTWAMMLMGLTGLGFVGLRSRNSMPFSSF
jgi:hypothetical protein